MRLMSKLTCAVFLMVALVAMLYLPVMGLTSGGKDVSPGWHAVEAPSVANLSDAWFSPASAYAEMVAPSSLANVPAMEEVTAPADPVKSSLISNVFKALLGLLPVMMSFLSPYLTHGVQLVWGKLPPTAAAGLSVLIGSGIATICAVIFPGALPPDVAATLGAGGGAQAHAMSQKSPISTT